MTLQENRNLTRLSFFFRTAFLVSLLGFLVFSNTIRNDYALDDSGAVTKNLFVQKGLAGIPDILKSDLWHFDNVSLGYYRPLSLISFAIEVEFFGLNPHISHGGNAILFGLLVFFVFLLLQALFGEKIPLLPFTASLIFALHPIHTEVVANIKSRDELLSFLNLTAALFFLVKYAQNNGSKRILFFLGTCICFYLSLISKETSLVFLGLGPLVLFSSGTLKKGNTLPFAIAGLVITIVFLIQKYTLMGTLSGTVPVDIINYPYRTFGEKFFTAWVIFLRCVYLLFVPFNLKYDYSYNAIPPAGPDNPGVYAGALVFAGLVFSLMKEYRNNTPGFFSKLFFLFTLAPSAAFVMLRGGIFAERFLFAPSLGFAVWLGSMLLSRKPFVSNSWLGKAPVPKHFFSILLLLSVAYSVRTVSRNMVWENNFSLFMTDLKSNPRSAQTQRHAGSENINRAIAEKDSLKKVAYLNTGLTCLKNALRIHPTFGDAYFKLGVAYQAVIHNQDSAIYYYTRAIETAPAYAISYNNLGIIYQERKEYELSSYYYNKAVEMNPNFPDAKKNAENLKAQTGLDVRVFPTGMNLDSLSLAYGEKKDDAFYYNLGTMYASKGDYKTAMENLKKSTGLNPRNLDAYINLGNCYGMLKMYPEAIACSEYVLKFQPENSRALQNLMVTYDLLGRKGEAEVYRKRLSKVVGN